MECFMTYLVPLLLHIVFLIVIQISLRQAVIIAGHKTSKSREGGTSGLTSEALQSNSRILALVKSDSCLHNLKDLHTQATILVICDIVYKSYLQLPGTARDSSNNRFHCTHLNVCVLSFHLVGGLKQANSLFVMIQYCKYHFLHFENVSMTAIRE